MKIRTGFVSNSSSSSFVIMIDKENLDKTEFTEKERLFLNEMLTDEPEDFVGRKVITYTNYTTMGEWDYETGPELPEDYEEDIDAYLEDLLNRLPPGSTIYSSVDM